MSEQTAQRVWFVTCASTGFGREMAQPTSLGANFPEGK